MKPSERAAGCLLGEMPYKPLNKMATELLRDRIADAISAAEREAFEAGYREAIGVDDFPLDPKVYDEWRRDRE